MTDTQLREAVVVDAVLEADVRYADGHLDAFGSGVLGAIPVVADIKFSKQGITPEELMTSTRKGLDREGKDKLFPEAMQLIWAAWATHVTDGELSAQEALDAYKTIARGTAGYTKFRDAVKQGVAHVLQVTEDKKAQSSAVRAANAALSATPTMTLARIESEMAHLASGITTAADIKKAQALASALLDACK